MALHTEGSPSIEAVPFCSSGPQPGPRRGMASRCFCMVLLIGLTIFWAAAVLAQTQPVPLRPSAALGQAVAAGFRSFTVVVLDENGVAVPSARVILTSPNGQVLRGETDYSGRVFFHVHPGSYAVTIEKTGFYRVKAGTFHVEQASTVEAVLPHEQEVRESVDVVESPPIIDPAQTARTEVLTKREILNIPYPTSRDIRYALPLLPGIVRDQSGFVHIGGASVTQTYYLLDGFDIGMPTTSFENMRVSVDSLRSIQAETSRYSAEYGKGTSVLGLETGIGDDKFRFSATNFIPSFQLKKGLNYNQWVPRAAVSGPIRKGKAWFFDSPDAEYTQTIVPELPDGADRSTSWRISNLSKVQVNLKPNNILTTEVLVNSFHAKNAGLSVFNPVETTVNSRANAWMAGLRDQHYFASGALLEAGVAVDNFENSSTPLGNVPYVLTPGTASGSYFENTNGNGRRVQGNADLFLAPRQWHGRHEFKVGIGADSINYIRQFFFEPIHYYRTDQTLARESTFSNSPRLRLSNFEASAYGLDRWKPTDRLLIESGLRFDWDEIIRDVLVSPRLAATYMVPGTSETKVSAGVGVFYQAANLDLIGQPQAGTRQDVFYAPNGVTPIGLPVTTQFFADRNALKEPRFVSWSVGVERKLPYSIYGHLDFLQKRGTDGFVYLNTNSGDIVGRYVLTNKRDDHYNALTLSVRRTFKDQYPLFFAYTRSSAQTNYVFAFNQGSPVIGLQQSGPLPWDTPNRFLTWGWAPFFKKMTLGYAFEFRNGYPFTVVNQYQEVAGRVGPYRYPAFYQITLSLEKRFQLFGYYLALRGTVENITNRENPNVVDNNIDSPGFLSFSGTGHRSFTARIRFLGRTKDKDKTKPKAPQPNSMP